MDCPSCPRSLPSPSALAIHRLTSHIGLRRLNWSCGDCDFQARSLHHLIGHCLLEGHASTSSRLASFPSRYYVIGTFAISRNPAKEESERIKKAFTIQEQRAVENPESKEQRNTNGNGSWTLDPPRTKAQVKSEPAFELEPEALPVNHCSKCGTGQKNGAFQSIFRHSIACCALKPFACSDCRQTFSLRHHVLAHSSKYCPNGTVVLPER